MKTPPGGWPLVAQVSIAVLIAIGLSIWQVSRAIDKMALKDEYESRLQQPELKEAELDRSSADYRKIAIRGRFDPQRHFIIEDRAMQGRPGYWIFGVFNSDSDRYLVNRGWTPALASVRIDPDIEQFETPLTIHAVIWPNEIIRTSTTTTNPDWPIRLREVDIGLMARMTSARAQEFRLIRASPGVLTPAPLRLDFSTVTHWSYSFQWLLIGALVIGGYWFFTVRKGKGPDDK